MNVSSKAAPKNVYVLHNSVRTVLIFRASYIRALVADGVHVICVAIDDDEVAAQALTDMGVELVLVKSKFILFRAIEFNFRLLLRAKGDVFTAPLLCHFITTSVLAFPIVIINRNVSCFIEGLGTFFTGRALFTKSIAWFLKTFASRRVFMNSAEKDLIGEPDDKVLNGIGVDIDQFEFAEIANTDGREDFEQLNLLFVGRLVSDKGVVDCMSVLRQLHERGVKAVLTLVGEQYPGNPGNLDDLAIETLKKEFGNTINFAGQQSDLSKYYQAADALLLLSKHEGFPVVVMEANACGTPAVVFDVLGCRDAVQHGVNGYLYPKGDVDAVANCLEENTFATMRKACREVAEERFDVNDRVQCIREIVGTA